MKLEEEKVTIIPKNGVFEAIVYFLLDGDEVVYVGKSINGLQRVFYAHRDKVYTDVAIKIIQDASVLNYAERYFIEKYKPKYNKSYLDGVSLEKVREFFRQYELEKCNSADWSVEEWRDFNAEYDLYFTENMLKEYQVPIIFYKTNQGSMKRGISNHAMAWLIKNYVG